MVNRIRQRDKQPLWLADEVGYETWGEPYMILGSISPRTSYVSEQGMGVLGENTTVFCCERTAVTTIIKENSMIWQGRGRNKDDAPDKDQDAVTHKITKNGIQVTADGRYVLITMTSQKNYNPLVV